LKTLHVVLRDNFVFICFIERDEVFQRNGRDDDPSGVDGSVAGEAFERSSNVKDFFDAGVALSRDGKGRLDFHCLLQLDIELIGDELGDAIDLREAHVENAADVFNRGADAKRAEGNNLGDLFAAVLLSDILNDFPAASRVEVDVDIGHADALGIEKSFKE